MIQKIILLAIFELLLITCGRCKVGDRNVIHYTNVWTVHLSKNDDGVLEKLKMFEGFEVVQQVQNLFYSSRKIFLQCAQDYVSMGKLFKFLIQSLDRVCQGYPCYRDCFRNLEFTSIIWIQSIQISMLNVFNSGSGIFRRQD